VETFIVRIYRSASDSADGPVGTVECVGCGERRGFAGRDELWERLFVGGTHAHERQPDDDGTEGWRWSASTDATSGRRSDP
jgi:hypothetical protein